ncbi:hypothetical protein QBC39DRAFT_345164 [Podospora conica]|nr:hypothetical protein QBC39DRAFT_345164 [Schizothecium conicum]
MKEAKTASCLLLVVVVVVNPEVVLFDFLSRKTEFSMSPAGLAGTLDVANRPGYRRSTSITSSPQPTRNSLVPPIPSSISRRRRRPPVLPSCDSAPSVFCCTQKPQLESLAR